jgi:hypothetical protein
MPSPTMLTPAEKIRFMEWLDEEAATNEKLAEQADKLSAFSGVVSKRLRQMAIACRIVSEALRGAQTETIGEDDVG